MLAQVTLIGNLGRDPEVVTTKNGKTYTKFSLATSHGHGEYKKTNWFDVKVFDKQGELTAKYLSKGRQVHVSGDLEIDRWTGNDGSMRTSVTVLANSVTFLSSSNRTQVDDHQVPESETSSYSSTHTVEVEEDPFVTSPLPSAPKIPNNNII